MHTKKKKKSTYFVFDLKNFNILSKLNIWLKKEQAWGVLRYGFGLNKQAIT